MRTAPTRSMFRIMERIPSMSRPETEGRPLSAAKRSAVTKAAQLLQAFDGPRQTRGVSDLAAELSMPKPTVHRMLADLCDSGLVERLPWGRYQIGLRMFQLGTLAKGPATLRSLALPHLHELFNATTFTVYLTIVDHGHAVQLERLAAPRRPEVRARWGSRWIPHCSSGGKVLLAYGAVDVQDYITRLEPLTRHSIRDPTTLISELENVRANGYAISRQESLLGVYGVAAPIRDADERVIAAAGIAGHEHQIVGYHSHVMASAAQISRTLSQHHWSGW